NGKNINIALLGDSVTLGAEAGPWWSDRSTTYTGRLITGLKERFPTATINQIAAYKGGITTTQGAKFFQDTVAPAKPDLLLIALGLNDASGPPFKDCKVPAPDFKADILQIVQAAKQSGSEVILVTPFRGNPFTITGKRIKEHRRVLIEIAKEENVACADVQTAWEQLAQRGIAPYSQLHNWINHPGAFGHTVYADCILGIFDE
ncbi:MAG: SGNH/GDSL hydrolase family protein, partial [Planctomycetes bacterium]|nr:SGNH/GDSL hydrolase family protein [Planctomycetota bacterium]